MTDPKPSVCRNVIYRGQVQGVGFRWTASRIAKQHAVSGFVRNLADGTVELLAQGAGSEVAAFLAEIAETMSANIEQANVVEESVQANLSGFSIRR